MIITGMLMRIHVILYLKLNGNNKFGGQGERGKSCISWLLVICCFKCDYVETIEIYRNQRKTEQNLIIQF